MAKKNLSAAKAAKCDEFYTQLTDIETELFHYRKHFKDAVIYCNCDNDTCSDFWKYFHVRFESLGLQKLIATHYDDRQPTWKAEYEGGNDNDCGVCTRTPLSGNGDFRSPECIEILEEADIIVTNPPFSLFREYVKQLVQYNKKFIIVGTINASSYKEIFPLIKENKIWLGHTRIGAMRFRIDESRWDPAKNRTKEVFDEEGRRLVAVPGTCWYTNCDINESNEEYVATEKYSPEKFPHYENFDAIEVSRCNNIPCDWDGYMGVPITFLGKYNPAQFEIIDLNPFFFNIVEQGLPKPKQLQITGRKDPYARIIIKWREGARRTGQ